MDKYIHKCSMEFKEYGINGFNGASINNTTPLYKYFLFCLTIHRPFIYKFVCIY